MIHIARRLSGPQLRALFIAALVGLIAGVGLLIATEARAQPAATAFASDRLSVEVIGAGPDVILIPGFASSREVWRPLAERLSATHRVHLVQLAGFAGEPWRHGDGPFLQPALDELARYAATLDRPAVIGHSMGGLSGLMLAQQRPELISRVMSVDSLPFFSVLYGPQVTVETARLYAEQTARGMLALDEAAFRAGQQQVAIGMARDEATRAAMVEWSVTSDRRALASAIRDVMLTDAKPRLSTMTTPVWAVYASDADGGAPAAMADAMWSREYAGLPGVRLERVDGSRHFIMADQPERLNELVDAFLAEGR
ncbi:alpha/beta hydrolase [Brevundimonas sp.]|uniref:alpha/beta fold hydrolase n=1 Tax=Brevundimonas sp. TaxID=1871086 RepID=UPI0025D1BBBD|nr:alpha/beta hydrolase [Brevundimonas sp.]